jgi:AraC-like DNA-binding protein
VFRECTAEWKIKDRLGVFNWWDLTYLISGKARYTIDGVAYDLEAGDLLCLPPGHSREARTWQDSLMRCFAVNFSLINLKAANESALLPLPLISHVGVREDIIQLYRELDFVWMDHQALYRFKSRALFILILHRFFELILYNTDSVVVDSRIKETLRYIAQHYTKKLSVRQMAGMVNLSPVYFGALFRRETGMIMSHYLIKTRVRYAENLLKSGEFRVNEVAERCGYNDIFHFYRQFKRICGVSPSDCIPKKRR